MLDFAPELTRDSDPDSGENSREWFASYDRDSSSWRMSQGSLFEEWAEYSATWPRSGMTRSGRAFERPTWARPIAASGCSSWPTATVDDSANVVTGGQGPRTWPTPRAEDSESSGARHSRGTVDTLTAATRAEDWRTPSARDWKGCTSERWRNRTPGQGDDTPTLPDQILKIGLAAPESSSTPGSLPASSVVLNPAWVSCLMGFPQDWCDIGDVPLPRSGIR